MYPSEPPSASPIVGQGANTASPSAIDRLAPARRPPGRAIGYQVWRDLVFLHWRLPAEEVARLLPSGLSVDTYDSDAWVGLVPFDMSGVRPWWCPALPGLSAFHETNVRTYVHYRGEGPGVWFFSLDAAHSLAVRVARWRWRLNYFKAHMSIERQSNRLAYRSRRLWPGAGGASCQVEVEIGEEHHGRHAEPGSLEHFLVERYLLYTLNARGRLMCGQVHHPPYPLHAVRVLGCEDSLLRASGLKALGAPSHALYSPGVDVEIFPLRPV